MRLRVESVRSALPERDRRDVHTNIPALSEEDAQTEHQEDNASSNPSVCLVRRRLVQVRLVKLHVNHKS
jgi:hypothetical protein